MALIDKFPEILKYIENQSYFIEFNKKIFNILEGDLMTEARRALETQLISKRAINEATERLSPINILKRLVDKLTKIYAGEVTRTAVDTRYQPVVKYYENKFDLNCKMAEANLFYNSTKVSALEPFEYEGQPNLRVIPSHQFLMYSDDVVFPNHPTIYIKFMGEVNYDEQKVPLFFIYDDQEFLAIDKNRKIYPEYMQESQGLNNFGILPVTYINKSHYLLVPLPDQDLLRMTILIVLLFTDLNYGVKYQAHSLLYGININKETVELNPDSFLNLVYDGDKKPELNFLKPEIDIDEVLNLIMVQLDTWLESKNIKAGSAGKFSSGNDLSGVSLMIKEMDTTLNIKDQMLAFEKYERSFWKMMIPIHNFWVKNGIVKGLPLLPEDFEVTIRFDIPKPIEDEDKLMDRILKGLGKVMTLNQALRLLNPKMKDEEIQELEDELGKPEEINVAQEDAMPMQEDQNTYA